MYLIIALLRAKNLITEPELEAMKELFNGVVPARYEEAKRMVEDALKRAVAKP